MKTANEINIGLSDLLITCGADQMGMYHMVKSGDFVNDFSIFTDIQSGKKSDDPSDPAAKFSPKLPDKDGRFYHTNRDVTWQTFKYFFPKATPEQFYNMTDAERSVCVKYYIDAGKITDNEIINTFLSYCVWATGNCNTEQSFYQLWYKKRIQEDTKIFSSRIMLDRITDIRLYYISTMNQYNKYGLGWTRGIMCMRRLLLQYC